MHMLILSNILVTHGVIISDITVSHTHVITLYKTADWLIHDANSVSLETSTSEIVCSVTH